MILEIVACDYCRDDLAGYGPIHVCKVANLDEEGNQEYTEIIHLCPSCYKYWVLERPDEQEIKLLEHWEDSYYNIIRGKNERE